MPESAIIRGVQELLGRNPTAKVLIVGGLDRVAGYRWQVHDRVILWDDEHAVQSQDSIPRQVSVVILTRALQGWAFNRLTSMLRPGIRLINHRTEREVIEILEALDGALAEDGSGILEESAATTSGAGSPVAEAISGGPRAEATEASRQAIKEFVGEHGRFDTADGAEEIRRLTTAALLEGDLRTDEETVRGIFYELRGERRRKHEEFVRTGRPPAGDIGGTRLTLELPPVAVARPVETLPAATEDSVGTPEMVTVAETAQPATPNITEALEVLKGFRGQVEGVLAALDVLIADHERLHGLEAEMVGVKKALEPLFEKIGDTPKP